MRALDERKEAIRNRIWTLLEDQRAAAFPGARGRIPNFVGASAAAASLAATDVWQAAEVIKCNPDAPQRYVRLRALREGKVIYMAVPRLRQARCFWELDPRRLRASSGEDFFEADGVPTCRRPCWSPELTRSAQ